MFTIIYKIYIKYLLKKIKLYLKTYFLSFSIFGRIFAPRVWQINISETVRIINANSYMRTNWDKNNLLTLKINNWWIELWTKTFLLGKINNSLWNFAVESKMKLFYEHRLNLDAVKVEIQFSNANSIINKLFNLECYTSKSLLKFKSRIKSVRNRSCLKVIRRKIRFKIILSSDFLLRNSNKNQKFTLWNLKVSPFRIKIFHAWSYILIIFKVIFYSKNRIQLLQAIEECFKAY